MNETKEPKKKSPATEGETNDPAKVIREGATAASIWLRQSPSGYPYYDFSLSRSWKSMSTEKAGYSRNFFARNRSEVISVVEQACAWIEREEGQLTSRAAGEAQAA